MVHIELTIGTHVVMCHHEGETLIPQYTWHESEPILSWTLTQLETWTIWSENDNDYVKAEAKFIELSTGTKPRLKTS